MTADETKETVDRRHAHAADVQSLIQRLKVSATAFDGRFETYLTPTEDVPRELLEAMRYAALAPGKRLRPYLVVRCCEAVGGSRDSAWPVASAIECVHAFSLIHDDLPAMDDDDLRRGRPTCHKQFGEALAILAGDALLALAFELITRHVPDGATAARLCAELARGSGWTGMIGGQAADVVGERQPPGIDLVRYIHARKTAALFETACRLGAIVGGAEPEQLDRFGQYGQMLGRAFQIADDLLDVTSTAQAIGKQVGKDAVAGKQTYPACVGIDQSRLAARESAEEAVANLAHLDSSLDDLRALAHYASDRNY